MNRNFVILTGLWLVFLSMLLATAFASPALADTGLPPRPTATPIPTAVPSGASIVLRVPDAPADIWTVIQWQDGEGNWHDVEGWRGGLDDVGSNGSQKTWWVAPKDFDTGPFRWQVIQQSDNELHAVSSDFYLPSYDGLVQIIEVSLVSLVSLE